MNIHDADYADLMVAVWWVAVIWLDGCNCDWLQWFDCCGGDVDANLIVALMVAGARRWCRLIPINCRGNALMPIMPIRWLQFIGWLQLQLVAAIRLLWWWCCCQLDGCFDGCSGDALMPIRWLRWWWVVAIRLNGCCGDGLQQFDCCGGVDANYAVAMLTLIQ